MIMVNGSCVGPDLGFDFRSPSELLVLILIFILGLYTRDIVNGFCVGSYLSYVSGLRTHDRENSFSLVIIWVLILGLCTQDYVNGFCLGPDFYFALSFMP